MGKGLGVLVAMLSLAACDDGPQPLSVEHAWVRLAAVPGRPAAAYFTVHGGPQPTDLLSVSADTAIQTEMHESMGKGSMASGMRTLKTVPIPANATTMFAPGGRHAMLFNMNRGIVPGRTVVLTLTFTDGTRLLRKASVVAAGDPAPH